MLNFINLKTEEIERMVLETANMSRRTQELCEKSHELLDRINECSRLRRDLISKGDRAESK